MVPWAFIIILLHVAWITSTYAADLRARQHATGEDLQSELKYLRALEQQRLYQDRITQPDAIPPQLALKTLSQFIPPGRSASDDYEIERSSVGNGEIQTPWVAGRGTAGAFAASSVQGKQPGLDAKAIAFSSVKDVESEGVIDDDNGGKVMSSSTQDQEKKSESSQQTFTVSEAMARKSGGLTTAHQNPEAIAAENFSDVYFVAIVAGCSAAGIFGVISAGFCFYRLQKNNKASAEVDYPAYGVTGPSKDTTSPNGDRKLAQSAQMYHYQHQKQQMIAVEKAGSTKNTSASDVDSEEENEEGDYTVYECPGLAPTGEMEVKNPLFNDDSTPMSPSVLPAKPESIQSK